MIVDIRKIIVKDRIRKDFGDIQELADDIKQNGLINPPVVNKEYELLAGERRLRACKSLGWKQIEIRMMDTRDSNHDFDVEVSENESRKDFSRAEREAIYTKRVERKIAGAGPIGPNLHEAEHEAAKELGTSRTNMNREREIIRNKNLLSPEDFANWDEGKLSTNKIFQKIKAEQERLKKDNEELQTFASDKEAEIEELQEVVKELKNRKPEIKEVEVMPSDYEDLKEKIKLYKTQAKSSEDARLRISEEYREKLKEANERIKDLEERKGIDELQKKLEEEADYFALRTYEYIQKNGGYVWITENTEQLPEDKHKAFVNAIYAIDAFAKQMVKNIGGYAVE